jgi:serine protease Do
MHKVLMILLACGAAFSRGADTLETAYRTSGKEVHAAFDPVRAVLQKSSAVFQRERDELIFGTVVSRDGFIVTKASELPSLEGVTVLIDRKRYAGPVKVAEDPAWDLALIKIDAEGLEPVRWREDGVPAIGTWLVANGPTTQLRRRVQVGVVAAKSRAVQAMGGTVLGVMLDPEAEDELVIGSVQEEGAAAQAGLQAGDRITAVDRQPMESRKDLLAFLKEAQVGDEVEVEVRRGEEVVRAKITLSAREEIVEVPVTRNDAMSGEFSERRTGFPRIMQHDIMGSRHWMGGPVLDLQGRCVGGNIARFSRCETYAIPAEEVRKLIDQLQAEAS